MLKGFGGELLRTDITAVKLINDYILAGIGSKVYVYKQAAHGVCIKVIHTLRGQKIYGFVPNESHCEIIVFGGKQFSIISFKKHQDDFVTLVEPVICDDWLHAAIWTDDGIALLTAHNVVQKWNIKTQSLLKKFISKDNSILYSGLLLQLKNDVLVMAGTVFSEVIIHSIHEDAPLHNLKGHKGVIFSICCHPQKQLIATTSDDRTVRLWGPKDLQQLAFNTIEYWKNATIDCKIILYGHTARVMRSCISDHSIVSVGEDSTICHWDFQGNILKKCIVHQNGEIWAVDSNNEYVVTGGADSALVSHPSVRNKDLYNSKTILFCMGTPKKVKFTKRRNLLVLNETDLIYYHISNETYTKYELNHETTFKVLDIFDSKLIAVADMNGKLDLYEEVTESTDKLMKTLDTKLNIGRILSMHFVAYNLLIFCSENGAINVITIENQTTKVCDNFILPYCKERWLTAAAKSNNDLFICGDRCGNVHIYKRGLKHPVKSFCKVHGRYGPTSIKVNSDEIATTGRDGTIKYFAFNACNLSADEFKYMKCKDLEFEWVECFIGFNNELICGFKERLFVICDLHSSINLLEIPCGGGHRSWDITSYNENSDIIQFVYIKNSDIIIATVHKTRIRSSHIIDGWHSKECNCLKMIRCKSYEATLFISGSEDTTLRITESDAKNIFKERAVFKNLSSVKTVKVVELDNDNFIIVSAGGRAQICVKTIDISKYPDISIREHIKYMIKGTDKERKGIKSWRECTTDFDPEMRILDLDLVKNGANFLLIAGCSDAVIRIFMLDFHKSDIEFKFFRDIKYHKTCILKTKCLKIANKDVLVTCTTTGEVAFWDISKLKDITEPFLIMNTNKSGINSFAYTHCNDNQVIIATGGDDNAIHVNLLKTEDQMNICSLKVVKQWSSSSYHSSQITGLCFVDRYMLSASIDQRVTLFEWTVTDSELRCDYLFQRWTDIADVHGLDLLQFSGDSITVCVFGKGMELMSIPIKLYKGRPAESWPVI